MYVNRQNKASPPIPRGSPSFVARALVALFSTIGSTASIQAFDAANDSDVATFADVAYGPDDRHRLDIWLAQGVGLKPLVVFIHGGGWNSGDKSDIPVKLRRAMLDQQISVASINYRFTSQALLPGPLHDAARSIQFLRSRAAEWQLAPKRIGAYGVSAGGCSALWLAFHDDLADPQNPDPMLRESTRLQAAVGISPQTSLEADRIRDWIGEEVLKHPMIGRAIGVKHRDQLPMLLDEWRLMLRECSPIQHMTADDPPTMLVYPRIETLPAANQGVAIHHAIFGTKLQEKARALGIGCEVQIQAKMTDSAIKPESFLSSQLTSTKAD